MPGPYGASWLWILVMVTGIALQSPSALPILASTFPQPHPLPLSSGHILQ